MFSHFDNRRYLIPFRSQLLPHIFTDTLVIGGGVAGMRAAIEATKGSGEAGGSTPGGSVSGGSVSGSSVSGSSASGGGGDVIILYKGDLPQSSTAWAQGGVAVARTDNDSPEDHLRDTLEAGGTLCVEPAVRVLVEEGPDRVDELIEWGIQFDSDDEGQLHYGREGGHHQARILHAEGDATGRELVRGLASHLATHPTVRQFDHCFALDLLTANENENNGPARVRGAITWHPKYGLQIIWAKSTILATGGAGQVFRETTNPPATSGDGLAMAWRAGAWLGDLEFIQFHPTTLYVAGASRALISEAVRGEGAHLVNREGIRFMQGRHDMAELAPRDVVSREIMRELARSQEACVYLDVRHFSTEKLERRFPGLVTLLQDFDLEPGRDLIPVHPAAHYTVGGIWSDLDGHTDLPGLFVCGEAADNGLHGANRLASNSLLEGLVYGQRAGRAAVVDQKLNPGGESGGGPIIISSDLHFPEHGELDLIDVRSSVRSVMWRNVGLERTGTRLDDVLDMFDFWGRYMFNHVFDNPEGWEIQNLLTTGALITRAARWREETRGVHSRSDHPEIDTRFESHARWRRGKARPNCISPAVALPSPL